MQIYDNLSQIFWEIGRGRQAAIRGLLFDATPGLTNLRLNFTSDNTFIVTPEPGDEVLGRITFVLDEAQQPAGYQFRPSGGALGRVHASIPDALREHFGDVHMRIESISEF